jgi:hypothetical protein
MATVGVYSFEIPLYLLVRDLGSDNDDGEDF